jgi:hypothetical protein
MSMPILPNVPVPVQPSLRIDNTPCPTNMPPPALTAVPLCEQSVNVVRAPVPAPAAVPTAARTLTLKEKNKQDKAVKKALETCAKQRVLAVANQRKRQIESAEPLKITPPDIKPALVKNDNMKPAFHKFEYVWVKGDTSPGHNRPDGYAFIEQVRGVGAATLSSIRMREVYGGRLFHDVPMQSMTPAPFLDQS